MTDHGPALNPASAYLIYALCALALVAGLAVTCYLLFPRYSRRGHHHTTGDK